MVNLWGGVKRRTFHETYQLVIWVNLNLGTVPYLLAKGGGGRRGHWFFYVTAQNLRPFPQPKEDKTVCLRYFRTAVRWNKKAFRLDNFR